MSLDPNTWTLKTTDAVNLAVAAAKEASHPEVTPDHLLLALLGQEGVVLPVLRKIGANPLVLRNRCEDALASLPSAYGSDTRVSRELSDLLAGADAPRRRHGRRFLNHGVSRGLAHPPTPGLCIHDPSHWRGCPTWAGSTAGLLLFPRRGAKQKWKQSTNGITLRLCTSAPWR